MTQTSEITDEIPPPVTARGGAAGLATAGLVGQAITFLTAPILARVLGPSGRGTVALVGIYDEVSTNVFNAGVPSAVGFAAKEGRASVPALLGATRRFSLLMLPVSVVAGGLVAAWPLRDLSPGARLVGFALVALSPVANTFFIACRNILMAHGDLVTLRHLPLVQASVRFVGVVALAAVGWLNPAVAAALISAAVLTANGLAWRRLHTRAGDPAPLRPLLGYGLRSLPGSLSNLANNRLDQLLIAPMLGTKALGLYAVAVGINFIPVQVGAGLAYSSFRHVRPDDPAGRDGPAATLLRRAWVLVAAACAVTGLATVAGLELLYGDSFGAALSPTLLLLPGSLLLGLHLVLTQIANAIGHPEHGSYGQLAGVVVTLAGLVLVLPEHGIAGAAVVSSVAYLVRLLVTMALLRREGIHGTLPRRNDVADVITDARRALGRVHHR